MMEKENTHTHTHTTINKTNRPEPGKTHPILQRGKYQIPSSTKQHVSLSNGAVLSRKGGSGS